MVKKFPLIVIVLPAPKLEGEKPEMMGGGMNIKPDKAAEPPKVVMLTSPVAPFPTDATMELGEMTVKLVTGVPPNVMANVPSK